MPGDLSNDLSPRHVGCHLVFEVPAFATVAFHIAVATSAGDVLSERLAITGGGAGGCRVEEMATAHGGRLHVVDAGAGSLELSYEATVRPAPAGGLDGPVRFDEESIVALRQSRYCPSDALAGFAASTFPERMATSDLARAVSAWVGGRIDYRPGSSDGCDTAVDTLLGGRGVCRDFAHLTIALCRALGIPARLASVFAAGLSPMDFHAVVEARGDHGWEVLDPTGLAPRRSLVRIGTGRDAADTALATTLRGEANFWSSEITATVDGHLVVDDRSDVVHLA